MSRLGDRIASVALAAALAAVAIGARGGSELAPTTVVELLLVLGGAAAVCAALLYAPRGRVYGAGVVGLFALLTAVTALSISWSISPDGSYIETGRTLSYLAVLAGAVAAARLAPGSTATVLRGLLLATVAVCLYGLAARVWPGSFSESALGGRIGLPYNYWNALGATAAIGLVPALWLGARRTAGRVERVLAYPAAGLLITTLLLTQSRGAVAGAALAGALWIAIVPLRLRSLAVLLGSVTVAAPVVAWALSQDAFRESTQGTAARDAAASDFGLLLLAMVVVLLAVGAAVTALQARSQISVKTRSRIGIAAGVVAVALPLVVLTSVAASDRGLSGTISDRFEQLTSETSGAPPTGGARFGSTSSSRSGYWSQAWNAFEERPLVGLGADSFELSRLAYREDGSRSSHAHGFLPQTLADLGLVGLLAALALLAAWLVAAARTTALGPRRETPRPPWEPERAALLALALAAVAYGVQSMIDWTWFVPGPTVMALLAAGFVAGRGPLAPIGALPTVRAVESTGDEHADAAPADQESAAAQPWRQRPALERIAAAAAVAITAVICCWTIWQPRSSDQMVAQAYDLIADDQPREAIQKAEAAHDRNPYSNEPLYAQATALAAVGDEPAALGALKQAVLAHPRDPEAWLRIAIFELETLQSPQDTLRMTEAARLLDPHSRVGDTIRDRAYDAIAQIEQEQQARERRKLALKRRLARVSEREQ